MSTSWQAGSTTVVLGLVLGLLQGLRHAFEPDHVVALSTMISEERTARARVAYAVAWGAGHALMLIVVGAMLMALRAELPARVDAGFEVAVSLMLVGLGLRAVRQAVREARPHGPALTTSQAHAHASPPQRTWRTVGPLAMGMVHGLAGSGALTALVVARLPSPLIGMGFIALFGVGATVGMALLAGAVGVPLARLLQLRWGMPALLGTTGGLSLVLGLLWVAPAALKLLAMS
jgi:hypothetical protein